MTKNVQSFVVISVFFLLSNFAFASERGVIAAAQYALKRLEYYEGQVDGLNGPRTRAAFDAFAKDKRLDDDQVLWSLTVHADTWKKKNIPNFIKEEVSTYFKHNIKDAESAKIIWETIAYGAKTKDIFSVCGKINAKNSYGAYVGYQTFLASGVQIVVQDIYDGAVVSSADFGEKAEILCRFGVVFEQLDG